MRRQPIASSELILTPLAREDESLFVGLYGDPETMQRIGPAVSAPQARINFEHALRQWQRQTPAFLYWSIRRPRGDDGIGVIALVFDGGERRRAEIGMMLRAHVLRRGLSRIAMGMLARHAFENDIVDELHARHAKSHIAARKLVEGLGYARVSIAEGSSRDDLHWRLAKDDLSDIGQ